jgi:hypothetical protein
MSRTNLSSSHTSQLDPPPPYLLLQTISLPTRSQPHTPQHPPSHSTPHGRTNTHQSPCPHIPTIHQYLQRRHIIHYHRPTHRRRRTLQIIFPNNQQYRKQFRATAHQQRRRQLSRIHTRQCTNRSLERKFAHPRERQKEQVLQPQRLRAQNLRIAIEFLNSRPSQIHIEQQEEDSETQNRPRTRGQAVE